MRVELHCHSTASDGSEPPAAVGRRAAELGLALFSLTDHDTCDGWAAAAAELDPALTTAIAGVELSAAEGRRTVHLLMYDAARDGRWSQLADALVGQARARRVRMRDMIARLVQRGVPIAWEDVVAEAGSAGPKEHRPAQSGAPQLDPDSVILGRPHLARALVRRGAVSSVSEAFSRYLGDGGPIHTPIARMTVEDALELAGTAGARVSLAHPHTIGPVLAADLLRRNRERGLDAIEAAYGAYGARERRDWLELAASFDAVVTGGSDFHGADQAQSGGPGFQPGVDIDDPHAGRLREWLGVG